MKDHLCDQQQQQEENRLTHLVENMTTTSSIPAFLVKRGIGDEYLGKRYLENEEVALLSVLDEEGQISTSQALLHFMCLLNKVIKVR